MSNCDYSQLVNHPGDMGKSTLFLLSAFQRAMNDSISYTFLPADQRTPSTLELSPSDVLPPQRELPPSPPSQTTQPQEQPPPQSTEPQAQPQQPAELQYQAVVTGKCMSFSYMTFNQSDSDL